MFHLTEPSALGEGAPPQSGKRRLIRLRALSSGQELGSVSPVVDLTLVPCPILLTNLYLHLPKGGLTKAFPRGRRRGEGGAAWEPSSPSSSPELKRQGDSRESFLVPTRDGGEKRGGWDNRSRGPLSPSLQRERTRSGPFPRAGGGNLPEPRCCQRSLQATPSPEVAPPLSQAKPHPLPPRSQPRSGLPSALRDAPSSDSRPRQLRSSSSALSSSSSSSG